jgi:hypothetical protein
MPKANNPAGTAGGANAFGGASALRQGAERMASMSPDDIRRQAATMKAMGPAAMRAMNPQMARMTDAQINMAIAQMEMVANNPDQLKMAADQMKNMSESDLERAVNQSPLASGPSSSSAAPVAPSAGSAAASAPRAGGVPSMANVSKSQFEQATKQMSSMSPEQLKQQAAMMRSMPLDTLRKANPQMAMMTDAQIQASISQLEQMAENPEMIKMAADQMKNMSEEQYEGMKKMMGNMAGAGGGASSGGSGGGAATAGGMPTMPSDPSKMMEALLSDPDQLNSMVKTMKQNPEMMKQMMMSQMGEGKTDAQKEQMEKAIDSFSNMDDEQVERYLKMANGVQRVAKPVLTGLDKVKKTLGISTKMLIVLLNLMGLAFVVMLGMWWRSRGDPSLESIANDILSGNEPVPEMSAGHEESEF